MFDDTELYKRLTLTLFAALTLATGCGSDSPGTPGADGGIDAAPPPPPPIDAPPAPPPPVTVFSKRASRSSTIAISDDDARVAMVNPDDNSVSVFQTSDNTRVSKVTVGASPSSVVIAGDGKTAYVANRADGTVSRVINIDTAAANADATADVGSEPVGLALSPSGLKLYVAEFAESRVSIIDTATMKVVSFVTVDRPRALVVTNNADTSDDDEHLLVSQFYGVPTAGGEVKNDGRTGQIMNYPLSNVTDNGATPITLNPLSATDNGLPLAAPKGTSPNQLAAMTVVGNRLYITSVSASPEAPRAFDGNVQPVVYVADITTNTEVRDASGTTNFAKAIVALPPLPVGGPQFIPGDLSDVAFLDGGQFGYVVGRAGDVMVRFTIENGAVKIGSGNKNVIDILGDAATPCQAPTGVVVSKTLKRGFVNCWASRRLAVVDLGNQILQSTFEASPAPADASAAKGRRFYFTGRARWSNAGTNGLKGGEGWSSCGSCHPDGLSDNITWKFGTGPRQTTSMDGSFSHSPGVGPQKQRIFNWTAVNDELHDFELNVRTVSFGIGVIVEPATQNTDCAAGEKSLGAPAVVPMGSSTKELADKQVGSCKHADWDDVTNFVKTIRPLHASRRRDTAAVARGQAVFLQGGCDSCHSGAGWTISRRPYNPASVGGVAGTGGAEILNTQPFTQSTFTPGTIVFLGRNQISAEPAVAADPPSPGAPFLQLACALRNVGTFGVAGNASIEARGPIPGSAEMGQQVAQGRAGYNIPSLYSLALGAPYLHHGQSPTLEDLFSNSKWNAHTTAGNLIFAPSESERADLIQFLLSIDTTTPELNIPSLGSNSFDICQGTPGQSL